jgi:glutamate-1-semialdehyde 2,1-aminomutase
LTRYSASEKFLLRAEKVIPLGSQTFSKSRTQYPVGISPLFVDRAKGALIWDINQNRYIDLVSSLASITIGYGDRKINHAIKKQLRKGVSLSLPGVLEAEVAELICELVPSVEMVRFGKNGTDATSAAVRLARAYTGRDHVAVCGYHGWQDWYIGSTTRNKGVPEAVQNLTHVFNYNEIESLEKIIRDNPELACVVMEPMNVSYPNPGFLESVRELTKKNEILLVFDETITGFRFSKGGAQELFGIEPDLSTFGKGIANGFPLSVIGGKREIMMEMEEIFFSGTFGGELLSLAAAKSVLVMHKNNMVAIKLAKIGAELQSHLSNEINRLNISDVLKLSGHPSWLFLNWMDTNEFKSSQIKTLFQQLMYERGVLILGTLNVSLAHNSKHIKNIKKIFTRTLEDIAEAIEDLTVDKRLKVKPLKPLFRVR